MDRWKLAAGERGRRRLQRQALTVLAGIALGLLLCLMGGAAALRSPSYGRWLARVAHLQAPPAPAPER